MPSRVLHQVRVSVPDVAAVGDAWDWLVDRLGGEPLRRWPHGRSWNLDDWWLVLVDGLGDPAEFQFRVDREEFDGVTAGAARNGWTVTEEDAGWGPRRTRLQTGDGSAVVLVEEITDDNDHL